MADDLKEGFEDVTLTLQPGGLPTVNDYIIGKRSAARVLIRTWAGLQSNKPVYLSCDPGSPEDAVEFLLKATRTPYELIAATNAASIIFSPRCNWPGLSNSSGP